MNQYQSESIDQLITALAKAQGEMSTASKDCKGYNYTYADLASVWGACREPLSRNGLAVTQIETQNEAGEVLITILGHSSGQWVRSVMAIRVKSAGKNEIQERGSILTYLRRYALSAIVGVAPSEDDDGAQSNYDGKPAGSVQKQQHQPVVQGNFVPYVSEAQAAEISLLLKKADKKYSEVIATWIKDQKIDDYHRMPLDMYEDIKPKLLKSIAASGQVVGQE